MKVYTKTGDGGETSLFGGKRVPKDDLRVAAYGSVDELNAFVGVLCDQITAHPAPHALLVTIQNRLFGLGAYLAADPDSPYVISHDLLEADVQALETAMDEMDAQLPPLRNFVLPSGHPTVSACHVCRTVSRRAERAVVSLHHETPLDPLALGYLNRLSDYFFVLARHLGQLHDAPEVIWTKRPSTAP